MPSAIRAVGESVTAMGAFVPTIKCKIRFGVVADRQHMHRSTANGSPPIHMQRLDSAKRLIEEGLRQCRRPYIAFSGGKDSLVVAHLTHQCDPSIQMIYSDDELLLPEHVAYIEWVKARAGDRLMIVSSVARHNGWFYPWRDHPLWREPTVDMVWLPTGNLSKDAKRLGYDGAFRGLRADESRGRALRLGKTQGIGQRSGIVTIDPIHDWSVDQVWNYIDEHDLPYCPVYDRLTAIGVKRRLQRVGPLPLCPGDYLLRGWPEIYAAVVRRYGAHWTRPSRRNRYRIPPLVWLDIQEALGMAREI